MDAAAGNQFKVNKLVLVQRNTLVLVRLNKLVVARLSTLITVRPNKLVLTLHNKLVSKGNHMPAPSEKLAQSLELLQQLQPMNVSFRVNCGRTG